MKKTIRSFIALDIPAETKASVAKYQNALRISAPPARWTRPEAVHFTVKFLGDIELSAVNDISEALREAVGVGGFKARFDAAGVFPDPRTARVLWLGIGAGSERLRALSAAVSEALEPLGFPAESRPFAPHLTLARFKTPCRFNPQLVAPPDIAQFSVGPVTLYKSVLKSSGAQYSPIEAFSL